MPNQKVKTEQYQNFGGINEKYSPYVTGPMEFLRLVNLDFQTPGSLSHRWGSTMYVGQTLPGPVTSLFEFSRLSGASYVMFSHSGGIFAGATTGQSQGLSLTLLGSTFQGWASVNYMGIFTPIPSGANNAHIYSIGANYLGASALPIYGNGDGTVVPGNGSSFFINPPATQTDNTLSTAVLADRLFMADGSKFLKFDGITTTPVGLPPVLWATNGSYAPNGLGARGFGAQTGASSGGIGFLYGPSFGIYYLFASYVNDRGFEGPIWPLMAINANTQFNASTVVTLGPGATGILQASLSLATPTYLGISAINIYSYYEAYNTSIGATYSAFVLSDNVFTNNLRQRFWNIGPPVLLHKIPASGTSFTEFGLGTSTGNQDFLQANAIGTLPNTITQTYLPMGVTVGASFGNNWATTNALTYLNPRFIEVYQNRLFLAGISTMPSTVWFSGLAEPEGYAPDSNFEVRTNDGDAITCLKSYSTRLYIWKKNSFHIMSGDNPKNFFLQEVSAQYGCLNNRCAVVYDDILVFLDRKGVIMWNGANLTVLSTKIQPTFDTMNYSAAVSVACVGHDKLRNQVLIAIPAGNSTVNNLTLAYDYVAGAWSFQDGYSPSVFAAIQGRNNTKNVFYGNYSGMINWFGSSFLADNAQGFTTYCKTRFLHDMGDSTQKMYRRLYINADSPASSTLVFGINFFQDYGSSVVLGTTLVLSQFQNRIDYGVSAKSIAFEMSNFQTTIPLRIHGFTVESRFLRRT